MESWMIIISLSFLFACQSRNYDPPARSSTPLTITSPDDSTIHNNRQIMNIHPSADSLPLGNFIWEEEISGTPRKSGSIRRLYEDGRLFSWSDSRRMLNNGKPERVTAPYAWRLDARISEPGISNIKKLIENDFLKIASSPATGERPASNYGAITWKTFWNSQAYEVSIPAEEIQKQSAVVKAIEYEIQSHIIVGGVPFDQEN